MLRIPALATPGALPLIMLALSACRTPPPPADAMHAGEARTSRTTRQVKPRATLPFREATALLTEPEPCKGSFAKSIACTGSTIVVGAPQAGASGKVWVYDAARLDAPPACLLPHGGAQGERFGASVSISSSGERIAVGSPLAPMASAREMGRVDVWRRDGDRWVHDRAFTDPDTSSPQQHLGTSVVIDDEFMIAGAPDADLELVDDVLETRVRWPRPGPGEPVPSVAPEPIIESGDVPRVRQRFVREGALLVWKREPDGTWSGPQYSLTTRGRPMSRFGTALALSGSQTVVSSPPQMTRNGIEGGTMSVFIRREGAPWRNQANAIMTPSTGEASDQFGSAIASAPGLAVAGIPNGNTLQAVDAGRVAVFQQDVANRLWIESDPVESPAPQRGSRFGEAVAVWNDLLIVGQPGSARGDGSGHVFAFQKRAGTGGRIRSTWDPIEEWAAPPFAGIHGFGASLASTAELIAVGAPGREDTPGHVVLFRSTQTAAPETRGGEGSSEQAAAGANRAPEGASEAPPSGPGSSL